MEVFRNSPPPWIFALAQCWSSGLFREGTAKTNPIHLGKQQKEEPSQAKQSGSTYKQNIYSIQNHLQFYYIQNIYSIQNHLHRNGQTGDLGQKIGQTRNGQTEIQAKRLGKYIRFSCRDRDLLPSRRRSSYGDLDSFPFRQAQNKLIGQKRCLGISQSDLARNQYKRQRQNIRIFYLSQFREVTKLMLNNR
ncbi:unnamed protein product [Paramecium octaurelia]|uniref:Uncharacterized protein n=1 Tax=Paramecium octaurelia TaxID=43137 RepID=A0A8S1V5R8_PAROT|nr:unnamed protein product [Paramecium octaurelia]